MAKKAAGGLCTFASQYFIIVSFHIQVGTVMMLDTIHQIFLCHMGKSTRLCACRVSCDVVL